MKLHPKLLGLLVLAIHFETNYRYSFIEFDSFGRRVGLLNSIRYIVINSFDSFTVSL